MYDTASTLRLLDAELGELAPRQAAAIPAPPALEGVAATGRALQQLPAVFARATAEVYALLASIRSGREQIRSATTDRLAISTRKLDEVSTATGKAALDIMDALDRAIAKVDQLETPEAMSDAGTASTIRNALRDELFAVMNHMQFQDITAQQIMHVQSLLSEMEGRLTDIAAAFDMQPGHPATNAAASEKGSDDPAFDPNATLSDAASRQALADSLVTRRIAKS